ncbi:hypothetical protein Mmc1_2167 [Magnetococcus marinus MC-1]|uniref:Uncharacterized protein n=1 Tax=Magnetococcus marinus (strain ATCC BAA-1437 / JCM 17883 / MC-1) TaxID=156889 RepID=A0L9M5_MAGMM|nr:hypothetical protein [Magnetococcus marinus]ABK44668.1 hypothetical protein Mmc1_2167 [Magnetococcus marinus MC-1]
MPAASNMSPEFDHLKALLAKCKNENVPEKTLCHLQALKTFIMAYMIQQNTLMHQLQGNKALEGASEDALVEQCADCVGDSQKLIGKLHKLLRKYEDDENLDTMEFRAKASQLINKFDKNLDRFEQVFNAAA